MADARTQKLTEKRLPAKADGEDHAVHLARSVLISCMGGNEYGMYNDIDREESVV